MSVGNQNLFCLGCRASSGRTTMHITEGGENLINLMVAIYLFYLLPPLSPSRALNMKAIRWGEGRGGEFNNFAVIS